MTTIYWHNGQWIESENITLDITDRGLMLGDGVFDTMLSTNGDIFMLEDHLDRLLTHAKVIGIDLSFLKDELATLPQLLLEKNDALHGHFVIRTTVTRGGGARGLNMPKTPKPTIIMRGVKMTLPTDPKPIKITVSKKFRRNEHSITSQIKSLNYLDNILAKDEAIQAGYDDAILLNTSGKITCASSSNVFFEKDGTTYTPPISDGVMDGTMRKWILETHDNVVEKSISKDEIEHFDACFITNSVMGIQKITQIDKQHFQIESAV